MKRLLLITLVFCACFSANSQNEVDSFEAANEPYQQEKYQQSLTKYLFVMDAGKESAELYYNLGNTYYRLNVLPQSILYYEKALKLGGENEDVRFNLEKANLGVVDKINAIPTFLLVEKFNQLNKLWNVKLWLFISITLLFLLVLALIEGMFKAFNLKGITPIASVLAILMVFTLFMGLRLHDRSLNQKEAILSPPNVYVLSAPSKEATNLFVLHAGLKVKIVDKLGLWVEIKLADGKKGWVKKESLLVI
jgi:tetratricopeptide (TPR) repeat protein